MSVIEIARIFFFIFLKPSLIAEYNPQYKFAKYDFFELYVIYSIPCFAMRRIEKKWRRREKE